MIRRAHHGWRVAALAVALALALAIVQRSDAQSPPPTGTVELLASSGTTYGHPAVSADGRHVVFISELQFDPTQVVPASFHVWVRDRQRGTTVLVSKSSAGVAGNGRSAHPAISADGRFVAFSSSASNLVPEDTNSLDDVFVHDRDADGNGIFDEPGATLTRVSISSDGTQANCVSARPSISGSGRYVAFDTCATNWAEVRRKTLAVHDIFVHDRQTGTTIWANPPTQNATNGFNNHHSGDASISFDGRYVAFGSQATSQPVGINQFGSGQIYIRDTCLGASGECDAATEWASPQVHVDFHPADAFMPSISADGRFVAFESGSTALVPGDTNEKTDIFVFSREARTLTRVNVSSAGAQAGTAGPSGCSGSLHASISGDGRLLTFESCANNLVADDTLPFNFQDVFVHGRDADGNGVPDEPGGISTTLISRNPLGATADSASLQPTISSDGHVVVFSSFSRDITPNAAPIGVYIWSSENRPPVADAGPDQNVDLLDAVGAVVTLDGSASHDLDGDLLTFSWTGPFDTLTGATISPTLAGGTHTITLTVDDGHGGTASDSVTVIVGSGADLAITTAASADPVSINRELTYSVVVTNRGPADATAVEVGLPLPANVTFVSASAAQGSCSGPAAGTAGTARCSIGTIANGAAVALSIAISPTASGPLALAVSVSGTESDTNLANNSAIVNVTVLGPVVIDITEMIFVTDTPHILPSALLNVVEAIVVQDEPNILPAALLGITETITVTDAPVPQPSALLMVTESVTVIDAPVPQPSALLMVTETVTVTDAPGVAITGNTPLGTTVSLTPVDSATGRTPAALTFSTVTGPGNTVLVISSDGPPPPTGFARGNPSLYYDLSTTATFTGPVQVCVSYAGTTFDGVPTLWHFENAAWVNITGRHDPARQEICGDTLSLSPFAIFAPANQSPSLTLPPGLIAEATSPSGASVTYSVTAHDPEDGPLTPACVPAGGATLPLGETIVRCTATDSLGAQAVGDFAVAVRDTTAPTITVPPDQTASQTSAAGALVNYPAPVINETGSGLISSDCQPASGSTFDVGSTTVTCTAQDRAGNQAAATFSVTVTALAASDGRMLGAEHIDGGRQRHYFAFQVSQSGAKEHAQLQYWLNDAQGRTTRRFDATSITAVILSDDPGFRPTRHAQDRKPSVDTASFAGTGKWNGQSGYTFAAIATDKGEPGRGRDTFSLVVRDSRGAIVANVSGTLDGGNIQSTRLGR